IKEKIVLKAIEQADNANYLFKSKLIEESKRILDSLKGTDRFAVLIAGRPYHYDNFINHELAVHFTKMDIPVITLDGIPEINDIAFHNLRVDTNNEFHTQLYSAAIFTNDQPNLELVQIVSFGCGHDAIISDELDRVLKEYSGKSPLVLKLDEGENKGPINIRVKSFIESIKNKRAKEMLVTTRRNN
ncbi:MAG TPA: acyl-CoA dehydratase activase-related protein, partial [Leptospiraceae bacterium]|nr:acyl-CoA dehydratase activase-related protein [Leptospiraceae bacterium]